MTDFAACKDREKDSGFWKLLQKDPKKTCRAAAGITAAALCVSMGCGIALWQLQRPRFQDLTIPLGTDSLEASQFLRPGGDPGKASFTEDAASLDLNRPGDHEMILRYGNRLESAVLHIEDTVPPQVEFIERLSKPADYVPQARDFVRSVEDDSETTVSFAKEPVLPDKGSELTVTVVVTDEAGNETAGDCVLTLTRLRETYALELGEQLTEADLLALPDRDRDFISREQLDRINVSDVGTYTITSTDGSERCVVTVRDTQGPELQLQPVRKKPGNRVTLRNFVRSATDPSGKVTLELLTSPDTSAEGYQTVAIEARDMYGNATRKETTLQITNDLVSPSISYLSVLKLPLNGTPDYLAGVTAFDREDGPLEVTVDASRVQTSVPGDYEAIYRATDAAGNTTVKRRRVEVAVDPHDPGPLVKKLADPLSDDPEEIRDYVRDYIAYSHDWGQGDPVVYGLTKRRGNCYVHAVCLQALLDEKGIENQLIWTENKTHYWVIAKIGSSWRHMDATPKPAHQRYSLMTDEQRRSTLGGREWDTGAWPPCE